MSKIKYNKDFLKLLNLKNKKFSKSFIKKKLVYLLISNELIDKNFLFKLESLIKKKGNLKLGFNLIKNCNNIKNNFCPVGIENQVNIYQDFSGNIINIDLSNNICPIDISNNILVNKISKKTYNDFFNQLIDDIETIIKFFEDKQDNFYDINNKGISIKTLTL